MDTHETCLRPWLQPSKSKRLSRGLAAPRYPLTLVLWYISLHISRTVEDRGQINIECLQEVIYTVSIGTTIDGLE